MDTVKRRMRKDKMKGKGQSEGKMDKVERERVKDKVKEKKH